MIALLPPTPPTLPTLFLSSLNNHHPALNTPNDTSYSPRSTADKEKTLRSRHARYNSSIVVRRKLLRFKRTRLHQVLAPVKLRRKSSTQHLNNNNEAPRRNATGRHSTVIHLHSSRSHSMVSSGPSKSDQRAFEFLCSVPSKISPTNHTEIFFCNHPLHGQTVLGTSSGPYASQVLTLH